MIDVEHFRGVGQSWEIIHLRLGSRKNIFPEAKMARLSLKQLSRKREKEEHSEQRRWQRPSEDQQFHILGESKAGEVA